MFVAPEGVSRDYTGFRQRPDARETRDCQGHWGVRALPENGTHIRYAASYFGGVRDEGASD